MQSYNINFTNKISYRLCLVNKKHSESPIKGNIYTILINDSNFDSSAKNHIVNQRLLLTNTPREIFNIIRKNKIKLEKLECRFLFLPFERSYLCDMHLLIELLDLQVCLSKSNIGLVIEINHRSHYGCTDCPNANLGLKYIDKKIDIIYTKKSNEDFFTKSP